MLKSKVQKHKIQLMNLASSLTQVLSTGSKLVLMNTGWTGYCLGETSSEIKAGLACWPMNTDPGVPWSVLVKIDVV